MTSTPDSIAIGVELQGLGDNTNTWGYTKLNTALSVLAKLSHGYEAIAITGDTTLSDTNYSGSNQSENKVLKFTGSLSAAASITFPSRERFYCLLNASGQTLTFKCSGGTGVSCPTSRMVLVYCDSVDIYNAVPNYLGTFTPSNDYDAVTKTYMETAIATAGLPATAGTVLVSASDTTAGYLGSKVNVTGTGAAAVTPSTTNPGANEVKTFTVAVGALGLTDGGDKTAGFTAAVNTRYTCNFTAAATIIFPSSATAGDVLGFAFGGGQSVTYNPNGLKLTVNGIPTTATTTMGTLTSTELLTYTGATNGWT